MIVFMSIEIKLDLVALMQRAFDEICFHYVSKSIYYMIFLLIIKKKCFHRFSDLRRLSQRKSEPKRPNEG
jgi:hypothetical protein